VQAGELVRILTDIPSYEMETYLLWPQSPHMPYRQRIVIDALVAGLSAMIE
jgi:DNA-binding transcriptional LysR family regulator